MQATASLIRLIPLRIATLLFLLSLFFLCSCSTPYLSLSQEKIDRKYLASTHVDTPDPRQANPPEGQRIIMSWKIDKPTLKEKPSLVLHLLFWDFTEKKVTYPLHKTWGYKVFCLVDEEFKKTGGILSYKAEIIKGEAEVIKVWQHQLWVQLISSSEEPPILPTPAIQDEPLPMEELEKTDTQESMDEQYFVPQEKSGDIYPEVYENIPEGPVPNTIDAP